MLCCPRCWWALCSCTSCCGAVRGALGGLVFGSFILLGLEILNNEPEAYLGEPQVGLVFVTTIAGSILGAAGAAYRVRRERELEAA